MKLTIKKGFTLVELMMVIAIIGLISTIILAGIVEARARAKIAAGLRFEHQMYTGRGDKLAIEFYFNNSLVDPTGRYSLSPNTGSVSYVSEVPNGSGASLSFNGNTSYQYVSTTQIDASETNYTSGMWFKTSSSDGGMFDIIGNSNDRAVYLKGGRVCANLGNGDSNNLKEEICSDSASYSDGKWHYVLHTFGGNVGGQELYVDGVLVKKGGKISTLTNNQLIIIGYSASASAGLNFFNGLIKNVRVYNTSLRE